MSLSRLNTGAMLCSYNGYTFGPTAFTSAFSVRPELDAARRTVIYATYTITVTEYIEGVPLTSPVVQDAIAKLTRNGGALRYRGRGFGDLDLNVGGQRDVKWGPVTRDINCEAVGAGNVVKLTWTVEFRTVNCPDGMTAPGTVLSFNFAVSYDLDAEGYTTRTYEGVLTIAQTRRGAVDKGLSATADAHREKVTPPLLTGFRRESQSHRLSLDKCELRTTVRDVQMPPNAPPLGVIEAHAEHSYQSRGLFEWTGTLSADYTLARGVNATFAVAAFETLLRGRKALAESMRIGAGLPPGALAGGPLAGSVGKNVKIIPYSASASEADLYGRTRVRLSVSYMAAGVGFGEIFALGGLWSKLPGGASGRWADWVMSAGVADALGPRGHARLTFRPHEDALVDACVPGASPVVPQRPNPVNGPIDLIGGAAGAILTGALSAALANVFPAPPPAQSWLRYVCRVIVHTDTGRVPVTTLPAAPIASQSQRGAAFDIFQAGAGIATSAASPFPPLQDGLNLPPSTGGETTVQQRTRPRLYVTVVGQALRAGYPIPVPEVTSINGRRATLIGQPQFAQMIVANANVPIVRADFQMTYLFEDDGSAAGGAIPVPRVGPFA